ADPVFGIDTFSLQLTMERRQSLVPVLGFNRFDPRHRAAIKLFTGASPNLFVARTDIEDFRSGRPHHPEDLSDILGQLPEFIFTVAKRLLGLFALRDIGGQSAMTEEIARRRPKRLGDGHHPAPLAVSAAAAKLSRVRGVLPDRLQQSADVTRSIVGMY